jgi:4a-hydroxytetrahydrobiopterin dehydratase
MARPEKLSDEEIQIYLGDSPLWGLSGSGDSIIREIVGENFPAVIGIVNAIAIIAEKMDHHPDILIYGWNKLRITLSTHDRGGLTELDFKLAKKIDDLKY